ncbi:putative B6 ABC transporter permease subunit 2 [Acuticoccus mangrovi]|uniref:ABC transporter permease n=1 Tax=Acuticoccus mangrovi TaxID=2796142 RepID=A0A934ILN4_9HYPH|nr:ABC transporter permease [Acuticoccus mangrovi]MBJ3774920.1 ABC transporter permease [Acuticoccus mangrovi]
MSATDQTLDTPRSRPPFGLTRLVLTTLAPIVAALLLSALVLALLSVDPVAYYAYVLRRGLTSWLGLQATLTRMAPLLCLAASLIMAFRAGLWNLGIDGQFLLGAVLVGATAQPLSTVLPQAAMLPLCILVAAAAGALWALVPALLKAYEGVNEIITTLMMTFLGISLANVLVKLLFLDPATTVPQTRTLPVADRLPTLPESTISSGLLIGVVAVLAVHFVMTRTAFGMRLRIVGTNPRAAVHAGLSVPALTIAVFCLSGALAGIAGAVEVLGVQGNVRADWNPAYGLAVIPLVFLARFNGVAAIVFVFAFSILSIGGESAARRLGVPHFFTLVVVSILLIALALAEYVDHRRRQRTT